MNLPYLPWPSTIKKLNDVSAFVFTVTDPLLHKSDIFLNFVFFLGADIQQLQDKSITNPAILDY